VDTNHLTTRRQLLALVTAVAGSAVIPAWAADHASIAPQPYFASVKRALDALAALGAPVSPEHAQRISELSQIADGAAVQAAESILKRYTLAELTIEADGSEHISIGGADKKLVEQGWRVFLLRVANPSARADGFNLAPSLFPTGVANMSRDGSRLASRADLGDTLNKGPLIEKMSLNTEMHEAVPLITYG